MLESKLTISCDKIAYTRGEQPIMQDFDAEFVNEELWQIVGVNGSGKTTLLKILAGLMQIQSGNILWKNEAREQLHYIGHMDGLLGRMSVAETLVAWAGIYKNSEALDAALAFWELDIYADYPISALSAGWRKRVALAKLVAFPRRIWLLDEPFTNLDDAAVELLKGLIATRVEQGGLVIFTAHGEMDMPMLKKLRLV